MSANERGRVVAMYGMLAVISAVVVALAAIACGTTADDVAGEAGAPAGVAATIEDAAASLVELQDGLPTGHEDVWYTKRLAALDYRVASLRHEDDGVVVYRVVKGEESFDVRVAMDARTDAARSVEIVPLATEATAADAADPDGAATASPAPSTPVAFDAPGDDNGGSTPAATESRSTDRRDDARRNAPAPQPTTSRPAPPAPPAPVDEPDVTPPSPEPVTESRPAEPAYEPSSAPPPPPESRYWVVTVPAGSRIATMLDAPLTSAHAEVGDTFSMSVGEALWVDGVEVVPAGARVWGHVAEVERARRPNKGGRIVLAADGVEIDGQQMALDGIVTADGERLEGRDSTREDIKEVGIGAGLGGIVGGILGGKKGVLIGVLVGGGGTFAATKGEEVELPAGTPLIIELRRDLDVTFVRSD